MAGILSGLVAMLAAGTMICANMVELSAPQNDPDGFLFLCNRERLVSETYVPELRKAGVPGQLQQMRTEASFALEAMFDACKRETGQQMIAVSGYRSYAKQERIYQRKLRSVRGNAAKADEYVARPGASEHQTGLSMDVGLAGRVNLTERFGTTVCGKWLKENCARFGFIIRYDKGWEEITGYEYEPWHVRYVGPGYSMEITEFGAPFESWLGLHSRDVLVELITEDHDK